MITPTRIRKKPISLNERLWIHQKGYNIEKFNEELDIPAAYKLDEKIEKEFRIMDNDEYVFKIKEGSIIPMILKFYKYLDEIMPIYRKYIPCKKGCAECCKIAVRVSDLEVIIIKNYLDKNKISYRQIKPKKEIPQNSKPDGLIGEQYTGKECPFLKDNICTIYPVRPYVCRKYIVFEENAEKCGPKNENEIVQELVVGYIIDRTYTRIIKYHHKKRGQNIELATSTERYSDIRDNFVI
jgi:Fe-S-cluster containining protein